MFELRPYQREGLQALWDYFEGGNKGNPLLCWPCGTGKSIIPAEFISKIMPMWPNQRFLMITHVKELIKQNYDELINIWPNAPVGIYSAGLGHKQAYMPIVFGGIQSMIKNPSIFGHRDIIFIDEAHLISQDDSSMYLTFLATMKLINPYVKIIGMTATPYRMGQGYITDDGLFTDIVHDMTSMDNFNRLIAEQYMAPIIPFRTKTEINISGVSIAKGDFVGSQLDAVTTDKIIYDGLREVLVAGENRRSWMIFTTSVNRAEYVAQTLRHFGIDCAAVHSKQEPDYNDKAIAAFKTYKLRSIVSVGKLTTGFNHKGIDLIADFGATISIPRHVQKWGRGTRVEPGKENCIGLDFGRNVPRLGAINDPMVPRKKGDKVGEAPIKICESCGAYNHASARFCCNCGFEFIFKTKLVSTSGTDQIIASDLPIVESFEVMYVIYAKNQRGDNPPYIKATYNCGIRSFNEFIFPEHPKSHSRHLYHNWWRQRHQSEPPKTVDEALQVRNELRRPARIRVWVNKKPYPEILGSEY